MTGPMNAQLIALLGVMLLPLFASSWRVSLLGLALQGLILGWIDHQLHPDLADASAWIGIVDLALVRGVIAPILLYATMRAIGAAPRNDILPPNLMSWTVAIAIVLLAFRFADLLVVVEVGDERAFVAVATAGLLLGLLILASQTGPFSQMVAVLRIQNAIALFELGSRGTEIPDGIRVIESVVLAISLLMFQWYLRTLPRARRADADDPMARLDP